MENKDYSIIYVIGVVTEVNNKIDQTFNSKSFKLQTYQDVTTETFTVKVSDSILKRRIKTLKKGDILLIKGNYYFNTIFPETIIRLAHFRNMSQAKIYLLNEKLSQDLYVKGKKHKSSIKTHLPIDIPVTEKLKTEDYLKTKEIGNEKYYRGYIKNKIFVPLP